MQLTSSAFEHEGEIPSKYTCDGNNINLPFAIRNIPTDMAEGIQLHGTPGISTGKNVTDAVT